MRIPRPTGKEICQSLSSYECLIRWVRSWAGIVTVGSGRNDENVWVEVVSGCRSRVCGNHLDGEKRIWTCERQIWAVTGR